MGDLQLAEELSGNLVIKHPGNEYIQQVINIKIN